MNEQQIQELVAKLLSDPEFFAEANKRILSGKPISEEYGKSAEMQAIQQAAMDQAYQTPQGKQYIQDMIREKQTNSFVKKNKPFFDAILGGADLVTSLSQIRNSNKAIRALQKPALPSPNVLDPAINNAISQAQQGNLDVLRQLEPAKQEIAQQRLMDIQTGRSVSGGQAGAYSANATAAGLRANRAASGLVPMADTIRARQQQRLDNLIGVRQGVRQDEFNNRLNIANINMGQYQQDAAAAAALGQAGRQNLRSTLGQLPELITRGAGNLMPVWDQYGANVEQSLVNRMTPTQPPLTSPQPQVQGSVPISLTNNAVNPNYNWNSQLPNYATKPGNSQLNAYSDRVGFQGAASHPWAIPQTMNLAPYESRSILAGKSVPVPKMILNKRRKK